MATPAVGLSTAEAEARRRRDEANLAVDVSSRGCAPIVRTYVFNFYDSILWTIGAALLALGRYSDALNSVGFGVLNALMSTVPAIRTNRQLDHLQLLERDQVVVVRDGGTSRC